MPKNISHTSRTTRVGEVIRRQIARILFEEFKDPRIGLVTIQKVDVSPDLSHARVYVTVYEKEKIEETIKILNKAAGFFRSGLSNILQLRVIPRPYFVYDESVARGNRLTTLLEKISDTSSQNSADKPSES